MSGKDENDSSEVSHEISLRFPLGLAEVPLVGVDAAAADPIPFIPEPARGNDDINNIIYINTIPREEWIRDRIRQLQDANELSAQYFSVLAGQSTQKKISNGELPLANDTASQIQRSNYRARLTDYIIGQSNWYRLTASKNYHEEFDVKREEFHSTLLDTLLKDLPVDKSAYANFEKIFSSIFSTVEQTQNQRTSLTQWTSAFTYEWNETQQRVFSAVRIVSYEINQSMKDFVSGKTHVTQVHINIDYRQDDYYLTESTWDLLKEDVRNAIRENSMSPIFQIPT